MLGPQRAKMSVSTVWSNFSKNCLLRVHTRTISLNLSREYDSYVINEVSKALWAAENVLERLKFLN